MVEFNVPNFITIGLIAMLVITVARFVAKAMGKDSPL